MNQAQNLIFLEVDFGTPLYDELLALRDLILRKPLGLEFTPEQLSLEWDSMHLACYRPDWTLLACLVLLPQDEKTVKMRQVAVAEGLQKQGIGTALVNFSEVLAQQKGFGKMVLHARETAVPFYKRLHYQTVGERFTEVNIPHFRMEKDLVRV